MALGLQINLYIYFNLPIITYSSQLSKQNTMTAFRVLPYRHNAIFCICLDKPISFSISLANLKKKTAIMPTPTTLMDNKAGNRQRWKLILITLYVLGSTKQNLYILCYKITERSVIQQNQIMLTPMVCLRTGAIIKQEWQVFITNALCDSQWIDNTLKLISYKYIPLEDLWRQVDCSLKWNNEKPLNDKINSKIHW